MAFKWKESYCCNIQEIDDQHKKLFELGSKIFSIATLKDDYDHYDEIIKILEELKNYTIFHFRHEESLMERYGYHQYESHKIEHDFFVKKLLKLERKDIDDRQNEALLELITFIADWVSSHILKSDMEYREFFHQKGLY